MKKLLKFKFIVPLLLVLGTTTSLHAQNFLSQRLLNAQSIYITNIFFTNLVSSAGVVAGGTNRQGATWTNNFGQTETSTNITPAYTNSPAITTNIGATYNLFKNGQLTWNRDSSYMSLSATNSGIYLHVIPAASGSAAATNAITFVIAAVPNMQTSQKSAYTLSSMEVASLTQTFTTPLNSLVTATGGKGFYFPINMAAFPGCQGFMLLSVSTTVAPTAAASDFWIDDIEYVGEQP